MGQLQPLVISENDVARDSWDDTAKGILGFRTLFSAGTTATQALTASIADLGAGGLLLKTPGQRADRNPMVRRRPAHRSRSS